MENKTRSTNNRILRNCETGTKKKKTSEAQIKNFFILEYLTECYI